MVLRDLFRQHSSSEMIAERDTSVLSDIERQQHSKRTRSLFDEQRAVRDVPGGIAVQFPGTMAYAERILDFIRYERRCSPFLTFDLMFEPEGRGIWLYLGGGDQTQDDLDCWSERLRERTSSSGQA